MTLPHTFARGSGTLRRRTVNNDAYLEQALHHVRDDDLPADVRAFHKASLSKVDYHRLLRAAKVAKNLKTYQDISRGCEMTNTYGLVELSDEEKEALREEEDSAFSERGMLIVIFTVSLAAFLQGHVQSSINGASLYRNSLDLPWDRTRSANNTNPADQNTTADHILHPAGPQWHDWALGATNAMPFLSAAMIGCWMALPISDRFGRKGSMVVAAFLVLLSSLVAALVPTMKTSTHRWVILLIIRIFNGVGMGIKAVNTPILASETAIGYWRGTSILAWQLWVAFGIFVGFGLNLLFSCVKSDEFTLGLILGAPIIASVMLLLALLVCPESPRWYMRRGPNYNPQKAYDLLKSLRKCELIALRDIYVLYKSIEQEHDPDTKRNANEFAEYMRLDKYQSFSSCFRQFLELFSVPRLRNALISSSIVALAQQLCGINISAFYSGSFFASILGPKGGVSDDTIRLAMYFSLGFGAVNFIFGIPAFRTIDTIGRRKWLTATLPPMALLMACAALSFLLLKDNPDSKIMTAAVVATFLYLHAIVYSPGLGPIPFTLAAESFPLANREAGCAFAVSVNLFFAGILSICFPAIDSAFSPPGTLGAFAGFSLVAFVLVFLFVEETRRISLEDLDFIYAVPKKEFVRFQVFEYLPWLLRAYVYFPFSRYILRQSEQSSNTRDTEGQISRGRPPRPDLYSRPVEEVSPEARETEGSTLSSEGYFA